MSKEMPKKLGRYEIVRELGRGAMGVVYEGRDPNIDRRVAIKTARSDVMEETGLADEMLERFLREAQSAGKLNHPNFVTIYDAGQEDDIAFISMEYLEGRDLFDVIEKEKRFDPEEVVRIGTTICRALAVAHKQGIVHRDVKPANIMVSDDGSIKITDFGIARVSDSNLTQEGVMIGTPHYMSPEQFMGQKVDGRTDLFAVAIILYEMLTGEKPFTGEAITTVMHKAVKTDPVPPKELNYATPDCLSAVIMKALHKTPRDRYQDGEAMAAALEESLKDNPNPAVTLLENSPAPANDATVVAHEHEAPTVISATVPEGPDSAPTQAPEPTALPRTPRIGTRLLAELAIAVVLIGAVGIALATIFGGGTHGVVHQLDAYVYTCATQDAYSQLENAQATSPDQFEEIKRNLMNDGMIGEPQHATVKVLTLDQPPNELEKVEQVSDNPVELEFTTDAEMVKIVAAAPGHIEESKTVSLGGVRSYDFYLCPE